MAERTIENPVTGERATYIESSHENGCARTVIDLDVRPRGGVPIHRHRDHDEQIEVLEGQIEVTVEGVRRTFGVGETTVIPRGVKHSWRNPSTEKALRFRGMMTPGHPGFERALRLLFGLARDGELRPNGVPKRLSDVGLVIELDPGLVVGALHLLAPVARWSVRRRRQRADELLQRYCR